MMASFFSIVWPKQLYGKGKRQNHSGKVTYMDDKKGIQNGQVTKSSEQSGDLKVNGKEPAIWVMDPSSHLPNCMMKNRSTAIHQPLHNTLSSASFQDEVNVHDPINRCQSSFGGNMASQYMSTGHCLQQDAAGTDEDQCDYISHSVSIPLNQKSSLLTRRSSLGAKVGADTKRNMSEKRMSAYTAQEYKHQWLVYCVAVDKTIM